VKNKNGKYQGFHKNKNHNKTQGGKSRRRLVKRRKKELLFRKDSS
jgi:GH24 family phage-related lysozyme (muramidase)